MVREIRIEATRTVHVVSSARLIPLVFTLMCA